MEKKQLIEKLEEVKMRSAWNNGVKEYAIEMVEDLDCDDFQYDGLKDGLLNGARNWRKYSYGGCSLIYDYDIANRLCTPSELKRKKAGELPPSSHETWLDIQVRALHDAYLLIKRIIRLGEKQ